MERIKIEDAYVEDGIIKIKAVNIFGKNGKCNLVLRKKDWKKNCPHNSSPESIAAIIKRKGYAWVSTFKFKNEREIELKRREMRRRGIMKITAKVKLEKGVSKGEVIDYLFSLKLKKKDGEEEEFVQDIKDMDENQIVLITKDIIAKSNLYNMTKGQTYRWILYAFSDIPGIKSFDGCKFGED